MAILVLIKNNKLDFKIQNVVSDIDLSSQRWTVDEESDFRFVDAVYSALFHENYKFSMGDILLLLAKHPELMEINSGIIRDEGLRISLVGEPAVGFGRGSSSRPSRRQKISMGIRFTMIATSSA